MARRAQTQTRFRGGRVLAWLVTGPLGHLVGFGIDAAIAWTAWARRSVERRWSAGRGRGPLGQSSKR